MLQSIRNKILAAILAVTLFTTFVITLVLYFKSADMIEEHFSRDSFSRVQQSISSLEQDMKKVYQMNVRAACDDSLQEEIGKYLLDRDERHLEELAGILKAYCDQNIDLTSMYLCLPGEGVTVTSEQYPMYRKGDFTKAGEKLSAYAADSITPLMMEDFIHQNSNLFSYVEAVEGDGWSIPVFLTSNLEERTLYYNYIDQLSGKEAEHVVLLDQEGVVIAAEDSRKLGTIFNIEGKGLPRQDMILPEDQDGEIGIYAFSSLTGCGIYMGVRRSVILKDLEALRISILMLSGGCLIAAAGVAVAISQAMYKPLKELTKAMKQVEEGNLEKRVQIYTKDEIGTLSREYNHMLDHIEELIARLIREERLKKDAELEALQYQITPHFMYNTLNSIKFAALLRGEQEIGAMIEDFVELLQASINKKGAFLTVSDEVHILENYLNLQRFRYEGNFQVSYEIEPQARACYIPRLLLQPLVENSLLHGLDMKNEQGILKIRARVEKDTLFLEVSDNGRGMTEEQLKQLLSGKIKKTNGLNAVGVPNIRERLELYYGTKGGIRFESGRGGTSAVIFLPASKELEEVSYVSGNDCG